MASVALDDEPVPPVRLQSICSTSRLQAIVEVASLLDVCCRDDLCPKARALVLTDRHLLPALGHLLGDLMFATHGDLTKMSDEFLTAGINNNSNNNNNNKTVSAKIANKGTQSLDEREDSAKAWRLIVQLAIAVASITHSATFGPAHSVSTTKSGATHMGAEMGGVVLAVSAALHLSSIRTMVMQAGRDLFMCGGGGGGGTPTSPTSSLASIEFDRASHEALMTGCVGALVGLSQLEPVRPFFALPLPLPDNDDNNNTNQPIAAATTKPTKPANKTDQTPATLARPSNTKGQCLTPVHVLLGVLTGQTDHRSNCLAILMNASLDLSAQQTAPATTPTSNNAPSLSTSTSSPSPSLLPSVKETIVKAGGMTVALSGKPLTPTRTPS